MNRKSFLQLSLCALLCSCSQGSIQPTPDGDSDRIPTNSAPNSSTGKRSTPPTKPTPTTKPTAKKPLPTNSTAVLSKAEAKARLAAGAALFDARSADDFAKDPLPNAINVPLELLEPTLPALSSYKEREILIIGKNKPQVESMRQQLQKAGFKKVVDAQSLLQ